MKSIYEEALQELKDATTDLIDLEIILSYDVSKIEFSLEKAQKQEKLLNLYKESHNLLKEAIVKSGSTRKEWSRLKALEQQIKELEK